MTDDIDALVKRLRNLTFLRQCVEAADAIEALRRERDEVTTAYVRELAEMEDARDAAIKERDEAIRRRIVYSPDAKMLSDRCEKAEAERDAAIARADEKDEFIEELAKKLHSAQMLLREAGAKMQDVIDRLENSAVYGEDYAEWMGSARDTLAKIRERAG